MLNYLVIGIVTKTSVLSQSCQDAARVARISSEEIECALEELGVCETDQYTIVEILTQNDEPVFGHTA